MSTPSRAGARWAVVLLCIVLPVPWAGCAPLPRRVFASARQADYFATRRELTPEVRQAIEAGHLLIGMDMEQVWVVLGDPVRKTRLANTGAEVWLYRGGRLHQDQIHTHGSESFRVVFVAKRVIVIETL